MTGLTHASSVDGCSWMVDEGPDEPEVRRQQGREREDSGSIAAVQIRHRLEPPLA